ncbi:hypothetical protein E2C01_003715 [Portunus trituberculatus]|uniref:Uncharacterized protein n=1 Tax=Portunus trituberculatus TaxID=210409 RepID=A0A5B7CMU9_PORTR|nr:hypothetical protein [Portunus trituberculatus]
MQYRGKLLEVTEAISGICEQASLPVPQPPLPTALKEESDPCLWAATTLNLITTLRIPKSNKD